MSNSDSRVGLFLPSVYVLPAQLTRVHLVIWGCRTIVSDRSPICLSVPLSLIQELKGILSRYTILMSFNQLDYNRLHMLTTTRDINTLLTNHG